MKMEGDPNTSEALEEQLTGCSRYCCDPTSTFHRILALLLISLLGVGSYFCYDNPGALEDNFKSDLNLSESKFMSLYSLYSWPNVILCFIGGFLVDRVFGIRLGTNIYMFITLLGHFMFALGAFYNIFSVMVIGRVVFGIGAESVAVTQNKYTVLWFKGKRLNMVFGVLLSFGRGVCAINFWVMEPIYDWVEKFYKDYQCLGVTLFIGGAMCVLSMISSLCMGLLDKKAERILKRNIKNRNDIARFTDAKDFPLIFWLITIICVAYYATIFPFIAEAEDFFEERFKFDSGRANFMSSVIYIVAAITSPFLGILIDKIGRNITWIMISIALTALGHGVLILTTINSYIGTVSIGLGYALLVSALWPLIALVIPEYQLGTAYGILQSIQNLGTAVISMLTGYIVDKFGYFWLQIFFLTGLAIAMHASILVWILDNSEERILNMTIKQRDAALKTENEDRVKLLDKDRQPTSALNEFNLKYSCETTTT